MDADYYKQRWKIVFYCRDTSGPRFSLKTCASKLKVSVGKVRHWLNVFDQTGSVNDAHVPGRPCAITGRHEKVVEKVIAENKPHLVTNIQKQLAKKNCTVSPRTIQRKLKEKDMVYAPVVAKPLLSPAHIQSRLNFARTNINRDWSNVVFSDEASFSTFTYHKRIWRRKDEISVVRTVKHPAKVHVWGCFSKQGFGKITCFTGTLTGVRMVKIYKRALVKSVEKWYTSNDEWIFQEDNDPKHTSKVAKAWKTQQNVVQLDWPSMSPDLNPIENVWALLKARIKEKPIMNIKSLMIAIIREWNSLSANYAEKLVESCQRRVQAVINAGGDYTIY